MVTKLSSSVKMGVVYAYVKLYEIQVGQWSYIRSKNILVYESC